MANEKFDKTKSEKVKIGEIGDPSHGEESLNAFVQSMAKLEARKRVRERFEEYQERVKNEQVELPKVPKMRKATKALLKSTGKLTIENAFEYYTPEEVYEEYSAKILESMKRRVGSAFVVESVNQLEMGEYSDKARTTEFNGKVYDATRVDVKVKSVNGKKSRSLIFVFSPYTVTAFGVRKEFGDFGKVDKELTLALRETMKKEFGEVEYSKAVRKYNRQVKTFKEKLSKEEVTL